MIFEKFLYSLITKNSYLILFPIIYYLHKQLILFMKPKLHKKGSGCVHHIPIHQRDLKAYSKHISQKSLTINKGDWHTSVLQFYKVLKSNPILRMLFQQGIVQCNKKTTLQQFLTDIQSVLLSPPQFIHSALIGVPINAVFVDFMATESGFQFFRHAQVNQNLKHILNAYGSFLLSPASAIYLTNHQPYGWFCKEAFQKMKLDEFKINPQQKYYGFHSWNDFFIRQFKQGQRPINDPQNSKIIINSCQSTPFSYEMDAKKYDQFWIKNQPYSIYDIFSADTLNKQQLADKFVGGTVYQGYLDALSYHRWHAPINGIIEDIYRVQGTYFSQLQCQGYDGEGPNNSQGYLTAVSVRLIIIIKADDQALKSVACVYIGMAEVSSCVSKVKVGDHVKKGDQLGYFQFGGSSHCLIFQKGVIKKFIIDPKDTTHRLKVNIDLAITN